MAEEANNVPLPPPPAQASEPRKLSAENGKSVSSALNLSWSFGMNRKIPVINLCDGTKQKILYAAGHTAILYDYIKNEQTLLQGHANGISCTCVSADKKWVVTGDKGEDNLMVVWDSHTGTPVRTIFEPHPDGGVAAVAMTPDAKYVATLSAAEVQTLAIWDWTVESDEPICTAELDAIFGQQTYLHFNPEDTTQIVSNSDHQVVFYSWKNGNIEYFAPPLTDDDFNKPVGRYSMSIFLHNSTRALTATSLGNLVTWDTNKPLTKVKSNEPTPDKKATKLVKLQDRALNVLTTTDNFIVTGDALGHIKFFDQTLKLVNWYQDFHLGPVNAISFAYYPEWDTQFGPDNKFPPDATIQARPFVVRDFAVGTTSAVYARVTTDGTDINVIHREHDSAIHGLAAHPSMPRIAVGSYSGYLKIWDYEQKQTIVSRNFERGMIRCLTYDPKGQFICIGFINGAVRVVDAISLIDVCSEPFRYARDAITHAAFSHDSQWMATADAEFTLSLYKRPEGRSEEAFSYIGRYKAHYKLIVDLCFGVQLDSDQPRLLSLGEDRVLVEYDLEQTQKDHIVIGSTDRIEQSAVPMSMTWYPPVTKESFILTSNDQYKFKLYNATTKMCRKTLLGPTFESPIQKIVILPTENPVSDKRYLAYITADKIGLHKLPLDGNPHNAMAQISHPHGVVNMVCSHDGKYLFTTGGLDTVVHMWDINLVALEAQSKLGGDDLIPFYGLLDGGREGELFRELEDHFYYAQLRSQSVDTMETRNVSSKISLTQVPFVMRALGFYPSEQEIEDMLNEIKYSNYVETGQYSTDIDLGELIKLFVNHRPAFGLQPEKLLWAFDVLGRESIEAGTVDRGDLLDLLQNKGEHITEYELAEYLTTLLGFNEEGGSSELQQFDPSTAGDLIEEHLPQDINADMFANEMLGFGLYSDSNPGSAVQSQTQMA